MDDTAHPTPGDAVLILVRHGESLANIESRFTLSEDEPLTDEGVRQAETTAKKLAELYRPAALYASPFHRALATARRIGAAISLEPTVVPELHEQSFGGLSGRPYAEYYPVVASVAESERWWLSAPGGESLAEVAKRVGPALDQLAERHAGEEVVVVSHGGVMAALRAHAAGNFERPPESTENAGGYVLVGSPGAYRGPLSLFDRAAHSME